MLTLPLLTKLYDKAPPETLRAVAEQADAVLGEFEVLGGRERLHFFLAQIGHESGGLQIRSENMNYSAARMMQVWPSRFPDLAATNGLANAPEALANKVYGGRMGNDAPGDGWKYRGRGFIQITGKDGYRNVGDRAGLDLVADPDLALDPKHCLRIACAFWAWKRLNPLCDTGDFVAVTRRINGGTIGMNDRFHWLQKAQSVVAWSPPPGRASRGSRGEVALDVEGIREVQRLLQDRGLYAGSIDGIFGRMSRTGLKVFQAEAGLPETGRVDAETLARLKEGVAQARPGADADAAPAPAEAAAVAAPEAGEGSPALHRGREIRRRLMGERLVAQMARNTYDSPIMRKFGDYATEAVFGMLWARPGLDLKTKTLICVVSDTATARWPELAIHLRMARRQGWTEDELTEVLLHLAGYIGLPSVREGMIVARETFEEMAAEGEGEEPAGDAGRGGD
ncbi:MAG: peptidoglycan-binding protein [Alphaproteobacteria bacterium]